MVRTLEIRIMAWTEALGIESIGPVCAGVAVDAEHLQLLASSSRRPNMQYKLNESLHLSNTEAVLVPVLLKLGSSLPLYTVLGISRTVVASFGFGSIYVNPAPTTCFSLFPSDAYARAVTR